MRMQGKENKLFFRLKWPVCLLCTGAHQRLKKTRKTAMAVISPLKCSAMLNVMLPALIDYVAFYQTVPVSHYCPEEGPHRNTTSMGGPDSRWLFCLRSSSPYAALSIMMTCICCFPRPHPPAPPQTDTCLYKVSPLRSDTLNTLRGESLPQDLRPPPSGGRHGMPLNFSMVAPTFELLESLMTQFLTLASVSLLEPRPRESTLP